MPPPAAEMLAIFDHDGVLVDSLALHQQAWIELGKRKGLSITEEFIRHTFGMTNPSIFQLLLGEKGDSHSIAEYSDFKELCYREVARGKIELMDGVRQLIDNLAENGFALAIGSSGVLPNLELTIESCGLVGKFAAIASLEDITHGKPNPEVFLVAARKAGIEPKRSVVFEDAPVGIEAAKAAGMRAVGVTTTHPADSLWKAGADDVVASLRSYDIKLLVSRLQGG